MCNMRKYLPIALIVLLLIVASALAFGACGGGKSDAEKASDALSAGLEAHTAGNLDEAAKDYRAVLVLDPQNKFAYFNLGLIDQTRNNLASAENNYRVALGIDPDFPSALFNLAIVRKALGDPQEAIQLYRHVISVTPDSAGAHLNLSFLLRDAGDTVGANAELATAVRLDPTLQSRTGGSPTPAAPQPTIKTTTPSPTP